MSIQYLPNIISNTIDKFKHCDWDNSDQKYRAALCPSENNDLYNLIGLVFQAGIKITGNKETQCSEEDSDRTITLSLAGDPSQTKYLDELDKACQIFLKFLSSNWIEFSPIGEMCFRRSETIEIGFYEKSTELENERFPYNSSKKMDRTLAACIRTAGRTLGISFIAVYSNETTPNMPAGKVIMTIQKKDLENLFAFFNPKPFPTLLEIALKSVVANAQGNDEGINLLPEELQERVTAASQKKSSNTHL